MRSSVGTSLMVSLILLGGCATITKGTTQSVMVDTNPEGAICRFSRFDKEIAVVNPTPGMLSIEKSKAPLTVICTRDGYYPNSGALKANFEPMAWGNILLGGIVGVIIDAASGADAKYDALIKITLQKIERANLDIVVDEIKRVAPQ